MPYAAISQCSTFWAEAMSAALGLHAGPALLGNVGTEQRLEFTVIGDTVNVARRLEELARPLGVDLVLSAELLARVRQESGADAAELEGLRPCGPQAIRGRATPIEVWTLS